MKWFISVGVICCCLAANSQTILSPGLTIPKLTKNAFGAIVGIQKGKFLFAELGTEYQWKKISLLHPTLKTIGGDLTYNLSHNILGISAYTWEKSGRFNLTYGSGLIYITDFTNRRFGISPQVGYRIIGFHFTAGLNIAIGDTELQNFNRLYVGVNYFIPSDIKYKFKKTK